MVFSVSLTALRAISPLGMRFTHSKEREGGDGVVFSVSLAVLRAISPLGMRFTHSKEREGLDN